MSPKHSISTIRINSLSGFPQTYRTYIAHANTNQVLGYGSQVSDQKSVFLNTLLTGALGYAPLALVYNRYIVHSARIEVTFANMSTTIPMRVSVTPYNNDMILLLPLPGDDDFVENQYNRKSFLSILGGGHDTQKVVNSISLSALSGIKQLTTQTDSMIGFTGSANSSDPFSAPLNVFRWLVSAQTINGSTLATGAIYYSAKIIQEVEFFDKLPRY